MGVCPNGASPYPVQPGDTLYSISSRFGISPEDIIELNPDVDFSFPFQVGQFICLPID
jgi:LysM repeat protein